MYKKIPCAVAVLVAGAAVLLPAPAPQDPKIARGRYLVERVAMCVDCHTPRNERGEFDRGRWLRGAKLEFQPARPMPVWAGYAPDLAGLPGLTDVEAVRLLTTGLLPAGKPPDPPMPGYKMSQADAAAVVAYLRSLKPAGN